MRKILIFLALINLLIGSDLNITKDEIFIDHKLEDYENLQQNPLLDETEVVFKKPQSNLMPTKTQSIVDRYLLNLSKDIYKFSDEIRFYGLLGLSYDEYDEKFAKDYNNTIDTQYAFGLRYIPSRNVIFSVGLKNSFDFFLPIDSNKDHIYTFDVGISLSPNISKDPPQKIKSVGEIPISSSGD